VSRRRRPARWPLVGLAGILIVGAATTLWPERTTDDFDRVPLRYRVVYRVEERTTNRVTISTERLWVQRPFDARQEDLGGAPPGTGEPSLRISAFGVSETRSPGAEPLVLTPPPAAAGPDVRLDAVFSDARDTGILARLGTRERAGRACRVYRVGGLVSADHVTRYRDGMDTHTELCVDRAGLVLERLERNPGRSTRLVAVEVDERPALEEDLFAVDAEPLPVRQGGGALRRVSPESRPPGQFWELDDPPEGFRHHGRFAVAPPQPLEFADLSQAGGRIGSVADVWVRGPDVFVVDRGGTLTGRRAFPRRPGATAVDLGPLGAGELVLSLHSSEVLASLDRGRYVRVYGTLAPDELAEIARRLRPAAGGQLDFLDD
jgi:hypothetical protein